MVAKYSSSKLYGLPRGRDSFLLAGADISADKRQAHGPADLSRSMHRGHRQGLCREQGLSCMCPKAEQPHVISDVR